MRNCVYGCEKLKNIVQVNCVIEIKSSSSRLVNDHFQGKSSCERICRIRDLTGRRCLTCHVIYSLAEKLVTGVVRIIYNFSHFNREPSPFTTLQTNPQLPTTNQPFITSSSLSYISNELTRRLGSIMFKEGSTP